MANTSQIYVRVTLFRVYKENAQKEIAELERIIKEKE